MFVLRKAYGKLMEYVESNTSLGNTYTVITRDNNPKTFNKAIEEGAILVDPIIYGFVTDENGEINLLSSQCQNYIMTEKGATFDNLSLRT